MDAKLDPVVSVFKDRHLSGAVIRTLKPVEGPFGEPVSIGNERIAVGEQQVDFGWRSVRRKLIQAEEC